MYFSQILFSNREQVAEPEEETDVDADVVALVEADDVALELALVVADDVAEVLAEDNFSTRLSPLSFYLEKME